MPSFLNKVFGYKKHDDKEAPRPTREASDTTLLDGKYEAIPSVVSPTNSTFTEAQQSREPDREVGFSLFRPRPRGATQKLTQRRSEDIPHLTLQLPGPKENTDSRALGVVFEADPDSQIVLNDADIAAKRLSPLEALILIRACAQAITERGLETLGIMHPHWFSASVDVQRRLISLFIRSLTQSRITTLSPTPTSTTSAFENELHYTRSPHDVAAVLRWGLRHLSLENSHFGKDSTEWGWYNAFFDAERNGSYPPKGFSELLLPHLPTSHAELLTTTLNLISSLASHAEANSISGSKLSKFFGLWLLLASRAEQSDDWNQFYARWERSGRILEHLFLARLRDESVGQRLPTRLQELVQHYPYNKGSTSCEDDLLPRPRFSTRQYDALFVRVETLLTHSAQQPKQHPIQLLIDAFQLPFDKPSGDELIALWSILKNGAFEDASSPSIEGPQFSRIFVDETIRLLSLIPADNGVPTSPTLLTTPIAQAVSSEPSSSISQALERALSRPTNGNDLSSPVSPTSPSSIVITDWAQFTLSGFGGAPTTQPLVPPSSQDDDDVEVTQPKVVRKSSRHRAKSRTRRRRSEEHEPLETPPQLDREPPIIETKLASVHVAQIDEAFIDFWSDAIVDPVSANWPTFVVCGLKQVAGTQQTIRWLVIEQAYSRQEPQPLRDPSPDGRRGRSPRPSFKSDISGFRINSVFASARKRFSVFNKSATDLDVKKLGGKVPMAGELGEVLVEEEATPPSPPTQSGARVDGNGTVRAATTSGVIADVADQLKADQISTAPNADVPTVPATKEESGLAVKVPSVEPTPQSTGVYNNGSVSVLSPLPVKPSEEITPTPRAVDVVSPKDNGSATPVTKITPLATATSDSHHIQGTSHHTLLASGPVPSIDNTAAREAEIEGRQAAPVKIKDLPVEPVAQLPDHDDRLHAVGESSNAAQVGSADYRSRKDADVVATSPTPEIIALVAAAPAVAAVAAVVVEAPEPAVEEQHEVKQPPQIISADPVAVLSAESKGPGEIDDLPSVPAPEVVATETGAQLDPSLESSLANKVEEARGVAEHAETLTPAPELVEETPGQEISVDGHTGVAQVSTAKPEALDGAAPQFEVVDDAASQPVAAELQATLEAEASSITDPVEIPCVVVATAVCTSLQAAVVETEHVDLSTEHPHVQDSVAWAAEATLVQTIVLPEVAVDVSAGNVSASDVVDAAPAEAVAQAAPESFFHEERTEGTQDTVTPTFIPECLALDDDISGPAAAADARELVQPAPVTFPEFDVETQETVVGTVVEVIPLNEEAQHSFEAEPPTRVHNISTAEVLSSGSNQEATAVALVEVAAVTAGATLSVPGTPVSGVEAPTSTPEDAPIEDAVVVVVEAGEPAPNAAIEFTLVEDNAGAKSVAEEVPVVACDPAPNASELVAITPIFSIPASATAPDVLAAVELSSESTAQCVDEAADPPAVVLAAAEETVVVEEEAPGAVHPTLEEPQVAAESEPVLQIEETVVVVSTEEPGAPAAEPVVAALVIEDAPVLEEAEAPALATDEALASVVKDAMIPEETEVLAQVALETSEPVTVDEPQVVVDVEPAPQVEETIVVVSVKEPEAPSVEPAIVEAIDPAPAVIEDVQISEEVEASVQADAEVPEPATTDEPHTAEEVESALQVEETIVVMSTTESGALAAEPVVVEAIAPAEDSLVPVEAEAPGQAAVEAPEPVPADEPQVTVEAEPALQAEETIVVVNITDAEAPAAEPTVVEVIVPVEGSLVPVEAEGPGQVAVEVPEPVAADEPQVEETVVVVSIAEPEAPATELAVVEAIVPASVLEIPLVPMEAVAPGQVAVEVPEPVAADALQVVEGAEPAPQTEETIVVVSVAEPETPAAELEVVEAIVPVVEDVPVPMEAEMPPVVVVAASEPVVPSQPEATPTAEISETTQVDELHQVVDHSEKLVMAEVAGHTETTAPAAP